MNKNLINISSLLPDEIATKSIKDIVDSGCHVTADPDSICITKDLQGQRMTLTIKNQGRLQSIEASAFPLSSNADELKSTIMRLHQDGVKQVDIGKKVGKSQSYVSLVINNRI